MAETPTPSSFESRLRADGAATRPGATWLGFAAVRPSRWKLPSREQLVSAMKTFAWVAPLTVLIWVYAEREQLAKVERVVVPIDVKNSDPNRVVRLLKPEDKNIVATLEGPRGAVDHVRDLLMGRVAIEIDKNLAPGQVHSLPTELNIAKSAIFRENGITVTSCVPDQLQVDVDELVTRTLDVRPPPAATNLVSPPVFEPRQVTVRGPKTMLQRAAEEGKLTAYAELGDSDVLKTPGHHDIPSAPVICSLHDERVTISPSTVRAVLDVREADVPFVYPAMTIFVSGPTNVLDKYRVSILVNGRETTSLPNVTLVGPPKTIELMQRPDFAPKPKARIEVSSEDATNPKPKRLEFDGLPEGVVVRAEDKNRTVEIKLVDRSTE